MTDPRVLIDEIGGLTEDQKSEILLLLEKQKDKAPEEKEDIEAVIVEIQNQIDKETDWRRRAALAAQIISLRLDV